MEDRLNPNMITDCSLMSLVVFFELFIGAKFMVL